MGYKLLCLRIMIFPLSIFLPPLVNLLTSTGTVLKKESTVGIQLLASCINTSTQNPAPTQGQEDGTLPLGKQSWGPKLDSGLSPVCSYAQLTVTECLLVARHRYRYFPSVDTPSSTPALSDKV